MDEYQAPTYMPDPEDQRENEPVYVESKPNVYVPNIPGLSDVQYDQMRTDYSEALYDFVLNDESSGFHILPGGINVDDLNEVARNMHVTSDPKQFDFYDLNLQAIHVPRRESLDGTKTRPYFETGYAMALRDLVTGCLFQGTNPDGNLSGELYRRDADHNGLKNTWHVIDVPHEYMIPKAKWNPMFLTQLLYETSRFKMHVIHGVRFNDRAFVRGTNKDGKPAVVQIGKDDDRFHYPFELSMDCDYDSNLVREAGHWLDYITVNDDHHSATNLARLFATPLLEPYKHLSYVLYGDGGNGKGLLMNALRESPIGNLATSVDSQKLLGGKRGAGGFSTDNEIVKLLGALWAIDDDADEITVEQMTVLKKISTGDTLSARRIQENAIDVKPKATFVICTNNSVVMSSNNAAIRRQALVRMRDGRKPEEFDDFRDFLNTHGIAPFIMASCQIWSTQGDEPWRDIALGSAKDLDESELWTVDRIVEKGYAVSGDNPYRKLNSADYRNMLAQLGLRSSVRKIDGVSRRVLVVANSQLFEPFRIAVVADHEKAMGKIKTSASPVPENSEELPKLAPPSDYGFGCDYVPVNASNKQAINWKKRVENPDEDTHTWPNPKITGKPYGVVPKHGYMILDLDRSKHDGVPDGWDILCADIGEYGGKNFPKTYLVQSPSGGLHAYYRVPESLQGLLKNAAHPNTDAYPKEVGGLPIDTRVEGAGYVVGAGSIVANGGYRLVGLPEKGKKIPELSGALIAWLKANDYVRDVPSDEDLHKQAEAETLPAVAAKRRPAETSTNGESHKEHRNTGSEERVDMSPVPEGQRNATLYGWTFGRLRNHPENERKIHDDLLQRGRASGLKDDELETIWHSALQGAKEA